MIEEKIVINSTGGLHAKLAAKLVQVSSKYSIDFRLVYKNKIIDLKSILGLMSLAVPQGESVILNIAGKDAHVAMEEIKEILI